MGEPLLQWQKRRARVLLASQKARWELLESNNAGFTVSESCTLGWLNVILRHVWPTLIEKEVAEATTKQIQVGHTGNANAVRAVAISAIECCYASRSTRAHIVHGCTGRSHLPGST